MNITVKINNSDFDLDFISVCTLYFIPYQSVMMFKLIRTLCLSILKIRLKFEIF
jgi:hypothetical protein